MANWSAFTVGGWDPLGSEGQAQHQFAWNGKDLRRNIRYQKRMIQFQNEQSKGMSLWSAQNMPAATMAGLKAAGLNPLLTAGGSTNVAPMVASSAASVPSNQSYTESDSINGVQGSFKDFIKMFKGADNSAAKAEKDSSEATSETAKANSAEQRARREFFESSEGKKAVRDRLRMDYGPQSAMQAAVLGAHSAGDAATSLANARTPEGYRNQLLAWTSDSSRDGRSLSRDGRTTHVDDNGRVHVARRRTYNDNSRRDNRRDSRRYNIQFNFGSSARNYDSGSNTNRPVWYNPDLK